MQQKVRFERKTKEVWGIVMDVVNKRNKKTSQSSTFAIAEYKFSNNYQ